MDSDVVPKEVRMKWVGFAKKSLQQRLLETPMEIPHYLQIMASDSANMIISSRISLK